jgi:hypothetical protein
MKKIALLIILGFLTGKYILAQDIDAIENKVRAFSFKKGIKMNGSFNINTINYFSSDSLKRRDPFNWFAGGNININLFGLDVPFSFSYTNAQIRYSQPFNRIRFAPKYKWIKTYTGTTNMTFSNYTLAGHTFKGFGFELTPRNWRVMAMYGKLKEAIPYTDQRNPVNTKASFKRIGYGLKVGYETKGESIEAIFFKAKDDKNSIPFIPVGGLVTPQENIVMGLSGKKKIGKRIFLDAEYAVSGLTGDLRSDTAKRETKNYSLLSRYIKTRNTTRFYDAANIGIGYTGDNYAIQLKYERVSPEYQTLGAYYFNSDLENYTIMPSFRLFKGKLNFSGNIGVQKDNLDKLKTTSTKRFVGNMNANFILNEKWNIAGTYSNFSSYTNMRPQTDPFYQNTLDTLDFYQVNQTFNGMAGYNFGNKFYRHGIMANASYQRASDQSTETGKGSLSDFYSMNLSYSLALTERNINLAAGFNYNENISADRKAVFMGPTCNIGSGLFKKLLRSSASFTYNKALTNGIVGSDVLNARWNLSYSSANKKEASKKAGDNKTSSEMAGNSPTQATIKKDDKKFAESHSISFSMGYTQRFKNSVQLNGFREATINIGYVFSFK